MPSDYFVSLFVGGGGGGGLCGCVEGGGEWGGVGGGFIVWRSAINKYHANDHIYVKIQKYTYTVRGTYPNF